MVGQFTDVLFDAICCFKLIQGQRES